MTDFLPDMNRNMDWLARQPGVSATALLDDVTYLVPSDDCERYVVRDAWVTDFDASLQNSHKRGLLIARPCLVAGVEVTFLFGDTSWAAEPLTAEAVGMADDLSRYTIRAG